MSTVPPAAVAIAAADHPNTCAHPMRRKPGRKPNPASPAMRKAQNRAAQRAFRERKERHILELEIASKQLREERDALLAENRALRDSVRVLGQEGWYLKGLVLTLQLVCLWHNVTIPEHAPHLRACHVLEYACRFQQTDIVASYVDMCQQNVRPLLAKHACSGSSSSSSNRRQRKATHQVSRGSILVSRDGIRSSITVVGNDASSAGIHVLPATPHDHVSYRISIEQTEDEQTDLLSSNAAPERPPPNKKDADSPAFSAAPVMLTRDPVPSFNLAGFQTTRMHQLLRSACAKMEVSGKGSFVIEPTALQLGVAHDPRIDLIPVAGMRDRMILFCDFFSLDECFKCILDGVEYVGGDPTHGTSWRWPAEWYEKYWYLSHDYRDIQQQLRRWPHSPRASAEQQRLVDLLLSPPLSCSAANGMLQDHTSPQPATPSLSSDALGSRDSSVSTDDDELLSLPPSSVLASTTDDMALNFDDILAHDISRGC